MNATEVFGQIGPVVAEAAKSPLGLAALAIIAVSVITVVLFGQAPRNRLAALILAILATGAFVAVGAFRYNAPPEPVGEIVGRGYYRDISETTATGERIFYLTFEQVQWSALPGNQVRGQSSGDIGVGSPPARTVHKEWREAGYSIGDMLFLSYYTSRQVGTQNVPSGIGAYVLHKRGTNYTGYIVIYDNANNVTLECPYVLATFPADTTYNTQQASERWPQLNAPCREVSFPIGN